MAKPAIGLYYLSGRRVVPAPALVRKSKAILMCRDGEMESWQHHYLISCCMYFTDLIALTYPTNVSLYIPTMF